MPKPRIKTKSPFKPSKVAGDKRIAKDKSLRKKQVAGDSATDSLSQKADTVDKVASPDDSPTVDTPKVKITAAIKKMAANIIKDIETHKKLMAQLKQFSENSTITRREIIGLHDTVAIYTELNDIEVGLVRDLKALIEKAGINEAEAEKIPELIKPSQIDGILADSEKVLERTLSKFKQIKKNYPDTVQVVNSLDFVDCGYRTSVHADSDSSKTKSSVTTVGIDGIRNKIIKNKAEFDKRLTEIQKPYSDSSTERNLLFYQSMSRQLGKLEAKFNSTFEKLTDKLEANVDSTDTDITELEDWIGVYAVKIESLAENVNKAIDKLKDRTVPKKSDYATYFKKQDPPKFKGDCLEYMEWKKRWESQVSSHSPPADFEMDLLKRNLPDEGRKKLYDCDSLTTAWKLLDKMFGDPKLIVQKLKSKLRGLKPKSKEPHEIIIEIADEVEYLIKRLRLLGATAVLSIDVDFLNSIYKHLPEFHKQKWDDFDQSGYPDEWAAFMAFCHDIYEKAINKRTRMEAIKEMDRDKNAKPPHPAKIGGMKDGGDKSDKDMDEKFKERAEKYGNCKICGKRHTYLNKFTKKVQPSDKFLNCDEFRSLNKAERGKALEKHKACRRCLSWSHDTSTCTMKAVSCKEKVNGSDCGKDHSKLVCGSGVIYCLSVRSNSDSVDDPMPSFPMMDDIEVKHGTARTVYDSGSQRVLIDHDFAREQGLKSENIVVNLELPGKVFKRLETKVYHIELISNEGQPIEIWGYGSDTILTPYDPIDLRKISHLFPDLPSSLFRVVPEKRIDILLGTDNFSLHPCGDPKVVDNLKAERSIFSKSGWSIGGAHPLLKSTSSPQLTAAANLLRFAEIKFYPERIPVGLPIVEGDANENVKVRPIKSDPSVTC